jgi:hypothetical protein
MKEALFVFVASMSFAALVTFIAYYTILAIVKTVKHFLSKY